MRLVFLILSLASLAVFAGDDASGTIPYEMDLSQPYEEYELTGKNINWSKSLTSRLGYKGEVFHFVRTNIKLVSPDSIKVGSVYKCFENPNRFYVVDGDLMFTVGHKHPFSPGVGGFSMFRAKSKNFIACLNCVEQGVQALNSSPVTLGPIKWHGNISSRF